MADISIKVAKGQIQNVDVTPTFENTPVPSLIKIDDDLSDLKGAVSLNTLIPNKSTGKVKVPVVGVTEGVQDAKLVFKYEGNDSLVENIGISTRIFNVTVGPEFTVVVNPLSTEVIPAQSNRLDFTLTDGDGNPITNATFISVEFIADSKRFVIAGYSNRMDNIGGDEGNTYRLYLNGGHVPGIITVKLVVSIPDISNQFAIPDFSYTNAGSPLTSTIDPTTVTAVTNESTALTLVLKQSIYASPTDAAPGKVTITDVSGPGTVADNFVESSTPGTYFGALVSNGNAGDIVVKGTYLRNNDNLNNISIPFEFTITAIA